MSHDPKGNLIGDNYGALVGTYDFDNMLQQGVVSFLSPVGQAGTPGTPSTQVTRSYTSPRHTQV